MALPILNIPCSMRRRMTHGWEFWIDRGGTFTDLVARLPDGQLRIAKLLSPSAPWHEDPAIATARAWLAASPGAEVAAFKIGTTVTTNALLQRQGARVAFLTTRGFGDGLIIGGQHRPDIFALDIRRPAPLYECVVEIDERLSTDGSVLTPLNPEAARRQLRDLRAAGIESIAIALLHGWRHTRHETALAAIARELDFAEVSVAHEIWPQPRWVPRASSTVANAYLAPQLDRYVRKLTKDVADLPGKPQLHFMQSSGGLAAAGSFRALASLLSGPAGGLNGMARLGEAAGMERLIGFDMGGTSTDVSLFDGELPQAWQREVAGLTVAFPQLDIHTIAAGGGSVVSWRDGRLCVGPDSAGASPGPAAYGRGGPATLTDVQLVLGRLHSDFLPRIFGPDGRQPASAAAAGAALKALCRDGESPQQLAAAALAVAVESMANAIRHVSAARGQDAADFTLFAFGGAAGQHACAVAASCGMRQVLLHPLASVLSACGLGIADWLVVERAGCEQPFNTDGVGRAAEQLRSLRQTAEASLRQQRLTAGVTTLRTIVELRLGQSDTQLDVSFGTPTDMRRAFAARWQQLFGYRIDDDMLTQLRIDSLRVEARCRPDMPTLRVFADATVAAALPPHVKVWMDGWTEVPVVAVHHVSGVLAGPALIVDRHTTLVLERGWSVQRLADGSLLASQAPQQSVQPADAPVLTAIGADRIELFNNLFMHVAVEMGTVLQRTAQSVNIKERLDYSCAVFDAAGRLVANAPHMPVHLGSMGASVRAVLARHAEHMAAGEAWLLNSPYAGGTHLPDMTVVSPVYADPQRTAGPADFFVASRAHHADIGGITPGSMPAFSHHIDEEGALFEDFRLLAGGTRDSAGLLRALTAGRYPARNPAQNLADLDAQLAANARGIRELQRAAARHGAAVLTAAMQAVQDNAADCVRNALDSLQSGTFGLTLDNGAQIHVSVDIDRATRLARVDFTGSSAQAEHNFHAPRAVVVAAVLYVFRTLIDRDIPLNEGCLRPLQLIIPPASLLDPRPPAAVVAGNVETSQCIVDALYAALGRLAASQGTMNNLSFGDASLQYYETIAGGAGASAAADGCSAVQTHMTNSRLTDPEILEARFPLRVLEFSIRRGSGGSGRQRGGDGACRRLQFLAPLQGAMLAGRRSTAPFGLNGGGAGAPGITRLHRRDGNMDNLPACATFELQNGDVLEILTPGGGGFGRPDN